MRLWSLHPKYLDAKGLVALWRETLLAKHVLSGKTKGYKNHPQLIRFKESKKSIDAINYYLSEIYLEANRRAYNFDRNKIDWNFTRVKIPVTDGQIHYEVQHLLKKLKVRDRKKYKELLNVETFKNHPLFRKVVGETEAWEKITHKLTLRKKAKL